MACHHRPIIGRCGGTHCTRVAVQTVETRRTRNQFLFGTQRTKDSQNMGSRVVVILKNDRVNKKKKTIYIYIIKYAIGCIVMPVLCTHYLLDPTQ